MKYEVCEGKTYSEAKAKADALCKREPDATIVHSKTEHISSLLGLKKEQIYKIVVAIPEYHLGNRIKSTRYTSSFIPKESIPYHTPKESRLSAMEKAIIQKKERQAEVEAGDPENFAARISHIAQQASLFQKDEPSVRLPSTRKSKSKQDTNSLFESPVESPLENVLNLKQELSELKNIILNKQETSSSILSEKLQKEQSLPDDHEIYTQHLRWTERYLSEREFSRYFIDCFIKELEKDISILINKNSIIAKVKDFLKTNIPSITINLDEYPYGDTIMMIGSTGVGKTGTLAKFAAHFGFTRKKSLRFLSIDRYKVGGESQLEKYANLMKAPFTTITRQDEFSALIKAKEADFTFIDTSGKGLKEQAAISELAQWIENLEQTIDIHLVVSATTKNADLDAICTAYKCTHFKHIIVTKLDETKSYGSVLSMAFKVQKPFSFFTDGQEIPQDFSVADLNKMISESLD